MKATVEALPSSPAAERPAAFVTWFTGQEPKALERYYVEMFVCAARSASTGR
ncbi:hypothetical protein [Streptomyces sp. NPDC051286]|uniref:hypothetical protein n=1 Tax=Streptomyces sp. NPDC051286 TaxID=3365647 RepID=UPI0037A884A0